MISYLLHEGKRPVHNFLLYAKNKGDGFEINKGVGIIGRNDQEIDEKMVVKRYFKYKLHQQPFNLPGQGYHYPDMNYMLCGFIIEKVTGRSLAQNIRERILEPLEMHNTYFEYYESPRGINQQVDTYLNKLNLTKKINTSYEWAGGGLVSTVKELGIFIDALFTLKLFEEKKTLEEMIDLRPAREYGKEAGMGIFAFKINGIDYFGHGGYYGSLLLYNPKDGIIFCANVGQSMQILILSNW